MATRQAAREGEIVADDAFAYLLGFLGVLAFSFTLPLTRIAAPDLGGLWVGIARAVVAALIALGILAIRRVPVPDRRIRRSIAIVAIGTIFGFGPLVSIAMEHLPSAHGVVVVGLLPAATAAMAVIRVGERPPLAFWLACAAGFVSVIIFALVQGAGRLQAADLLLFAAVLLAALGYAEGAKLARSMPGWQVICWALVGSLPLLVAITAFLTIRDGVPHGSSADWWSFAYLGIVSMLLGFFPWYAGLSRGGVARISQLQLVQPVLSLAWSALLLDERISTGTVLASILVIASAALTRLARSSRS